MDDEEINKRAGKLIGELTPSMSVARGVTKEHVRRGNFDRPHPRDRSVWTLGELDRGWEAAELWSGRSGWRRVRGGLPSVL